MIRVLIADDHAIVRDGLALILSSQQDICIVGSAANGREAIECAKKMRPDVIIMDISMPELNRIDAAHVINSNTGCTGRGSTVTS